jgi:glycosyltransferase involved in cell wall biosynthesis
MKVLLSAYACEPNRGSEPGVGWNWALEIAKRGHNVVVITRKNNKGDIEGTNYDRSKITFIYHDLSEPFLKLKRVLGVNVYYILWQLSLVPLAKRINVKYNFDLVHHITFGSFRNVSYIPFVLNIPFVFGPVGGGEYTPVKLSSIFSKKNQFIEKLRFIVNTITFYSPLYRFFLRRCALIASKTNKTLSCIPQKFHYKSIISLEIGIGSVEKNISTLIANRDCKSLLFVGRFVYLKGINLILESYKELIKKDSSYELTLIGEGPELPFIEKFKTENNLQKLRIVNWLPQSELENYYLKSSVLVFPSLHDSSGNVVLEALSYGIPVVSLDVGGPFQVIGVVPNTIVKHANKTTKSLSKDIAAKIYELTSNKEDYIETANKSYQRSKELSWYKSVEKIYKIIENDFKIKN